MVNSSFRKSIIISLMRIHQCMVNLRSMFICVFLLKVKKLLIWTWKEYSSLKRQLWTPIQWTLFLLIRWKLIWIRTDPQTFHGEWFPFNVCKFIYQLCDILCWYNSLHHSKSASEYYISNTDDSNKIEMRLNMIAELLSETTSLTDATNKVS